MGDAHNQADQGAKRLTGADSFAAIGVPRRFDLTHGQISRAYLAASRLIQAEVDAEVRQRGLEVINQAKLVLLNPEARAGHLLMLLGGAAANADRLLPAGFLMEMMAKREELQAVQEAGDVKAIEAFEAWAKEQREGYIRQVTPMFAEVSGDGRDGDQRADPGALLVQIRQVLNAWRYIERMMEQLRPQGESAGGLPIDSQ